MKRKYLYELVGGALLIVLAVALGVFIPELDSRITGTIGSVGFGLAVASLLLNYLYGEEEVEHDERTRKINLRAQSYSWMLTFFTLAAIGLVYNFVDLNMEFVYMTIFLVMGWSTVLFLLYFKRKPGKV